MKKALIVTSIIWACLFASPSQFPLLSNHARSSAQQANQPIKPYAITNRDSDLKSLYEAHQWFRLRDAVQATPAPGFYVGAVACAFNDFRKAKKYLQEVIESAPQSEQAPEARGLLTYLYQRAGRYRLALSQIEKMLKAEPDNKGLKNARTFFSDLSKYPEQSMTRRRYSRIKYNIKDGNLFIPLSANGKPANFILDTGANFSTMSESEARRLGLMIYEGSVEGTVSTGGQVAFRVAVADRLKVGNVRLRNVAFLVARDDQQPFVDLPLGERGVIGLPVLLAFQTLRWNANQEFEIAFRSTGRNIRKANMCFEGAMPVIVAEFLHQQINLVLDTGASETGLWPVFAREFATVISESGKKESKQISGVGQSVEVASIILPELTLRVGGFDSVLRPAHVLLEQTGPDSQWYHGRLGLDVLSLARSVSLDFKSMTLTLK
jgi:predicted aspartyl protease